jgi:hypothetical protein
MQAATTVSKAFAAMYVTKQSISGRVTVDCVISLLDSATGLSRLFKHTHCHKTATLPFSAT